ncbi:MAG TPA: alpha/beta hydrolase [Usitatibacter sp.]|nr:alpha/beta hydrolase [Usitatibacter sp.]
MIRLAAAALAGLFVAVCAAQPLPRKGGLAEEKVEGVDIRYGEVRTAKGYRVRTYISRPRGTAGRLPVAVFIPWLSCDAVENPRNMKDGWSFMLRIVMRDSGMQVVRIEKPGVGDSEGPSCGETDLEDDMAAFRAGIRAALEDPGVDPSRFYLIGGSVGGALAPVLAREFKPRAIAVSGGFTRTWLEHMLDIERRRLFFSGAAPHDVNAAMRAFSGFYDETLNRGKTPAQAIAAHPEWKAFWYDEPARQYGRAMRYYQQLQALDVEGAWSEVAVPALILWGEYDWIMGRDEAERAAQVVRARDPALVTFVVRPGMNHHFTVYPDPKHAFDERGGSFDEGAARVLVDWLRAH